MHRYNVYFKVLTPSLSGRKGAWYLLRVLHLQQLQGIEAIKHPLGQVSDLISIQHTGKSQHRLGLDTGNDKKS